MFSLTAAQWAGMGNLVRKDPREMCGSNVGLGIYSEGKVDSNQ
jgi:hypothetical protein